MRVFEVMNEGVQTVPPTMTAGDAWELMRRLHVHHAANVMRGPTIGCIPVTQHRRLVGIVTVSDLLEVLGRGVDRPARSKRRDLHYRVAHRKGARAW